MRCVTTHTRHNREGRDSVVKKIGAVCVYICKAIGSKETQGADEKRRGRACPRPSIRTITTGKGGSFFLWPHEQRAKVVECLCVQACGRRAGVCVCKFRKACANERGERACACACACGVRVPAVGANDAAMARPLGTHTHNNNNSSSTHLCWIAKKGVLRVAKKENSWGVKTSACV
jgi:hypothetical protein